MHRARPTAWVTLIALVVSLGAGCSSTDRSASPHTDGASATTAATDVDSSTVARTDAARSTEAPDTTDSPNTTDSPDTTVVATQPGRPASTTTSPADETAVSVTETAATDATTPPSELPTVPSTVVAPYDSLVPTDAPTACAFTPPFADGEVTWVQDGQLRAVVPGAEPTCLVPGIDGSAQVSWTSDAGRVLIDGTSTNDSGSRQTGFDPNVAPIELSAPTGSASISVDPATHRLLRHGPDGSISDISFIASTDEAVYHPGGKRIVAVGTDANNQYGIWLSSNTGGPTKQILSVADPTTPVTHLTFSADGQYLYFIHGFVHRLYVPDLVLTEIGKADRGETGLVASRVDTNAVAYTTGPCDGYGTLEVSSDLYTGNLRTDPLFPIINTAAVWPIGWLGGNRLVFASGGDCKGPADLWVWSPFDGYHHIAANAFAAAVRTPRGPFLDLPNVIDEAAPG